MSRFTRSTPPANAAQLRASADSLKSEIAGLEAEERDCNTALPDLVGDPAYAEVEARVRELRFLLPSKWDVLKRIGDAIPAAEKRECENALRDKHSDLERRTAKLARTAERRWTEASAALATIAEELRANEREWATLGREARELGEAGGMGGSAEVRARGNLPGARLAFHGFQSVVREARIPNWQGGAPLFDGDPRPRP